MGIYPTRTTEQHRLTVNNGETWVELYREPGLTKRRQVVAGPWEEERTNCFCCSCGDDGGMDPACRNHGFAATRPCELHKMPGQPWDDGTMPESVQEVGRALRRQEEASRHD